MSEDNKKVGLDVVVNNHAKEGFQQVKSDAADMAASVQRSGEQAAKGVNALGAGADSAAQKFTKAEGSIAASLQRHIEKTKLAASAGDSLARAFDQKIELRGLDASKLNPFVQQLREAEGALARFKAQQAESAGRNSFLDSLRSQTEALGKNRAELLQMQAAQMGVTAQATPYIERLKRAQIEQERARTSAMGFTEALGAARAMLVGVGSIGVAKQFLQIADSVTNMNSRLKLVTNSSMELYAAQTELFRIAQNSRISYTSLADTYSQMARSTKELGVSQKDMLAITQTISQAVTISGGSAQSAQAALIQLSQGFASGTLRGEELNSVMEQTPRLAQAIAQGMGVTIGQLRQLGSEGSLTAEKVVEALKKSALSVQNDFNEMSMTVEQASTKAANSLTRLVGVLDSVTGASASAAGGLSRMSVGMDTLSSSIDGMRNANSLSEFFLAAFRKNSDLNDELQRSDKELAALTKRLAFAPENIYVRSQIADLKEYIAWIKDAQVKLAALTGAPISATPDPRDQSTFKLRGASYSDYARQQAAAEKDLVEVRMRSAGVAKSYLEDLGKLNKAYHLGSMTQKEYVAAVSDLAKRTYEASAAGKEDAKSKKDGAKATTEATRELEKQQKLIAELAGLKPDFLEDWNRLNSMYKAGTLSLKQLQQEQGKLLAQQPYMKQQAKDAEDADKSYRKYIDSIYKSADALKDQAEKQNAANASFGKSKIAIAEMAAAEAELAALNAKNMGPWTPEHVEALKEAAKQARAYVEALREAEFLAANRKYDESIKAARDELQVQQYSLSLLGEQESTRNKLVAIRKAELKLEKELAQIKELYKDRDDAGSVKRRAELEKKARVSAETELQTELASIQNQYVTQQVQKYDDIWRQGFADMANNGMDGLKAFGKSLKTTVLTSVADAIYQALFRKYVVNLTASITGGLEGIFGMMGGAAGGATSAVSSGNSLMNIASGVNNIFSFFTNGSFKTMLSGSTWGTSLLYGKIGQGLGFSSMGAGGMGPPALTASGGAMSSMMSYVPYAAMIAAGMITGARLLAKGISKLFGRTLKDAGVEGDFGGDTGFEGRKYEFYKGGLFRSNKTKYSELDEETRKNFADRFGLVRDGVSDMAESIGLSAEKLDTFTGKIKLSLMGLSSEDMNKKISEEFKKLADDMAAIVLDTDKYTQGEETRAETLARLSGRMVGVNQWLEVMGDKLLEVSVVGADMASSLVDAFGGDDAFKSSTESYLSKYFTDIEKFDLINKQVGTALKELGIDTVPATRDALKELINAQDLTTEAGRKAYASLLGLADVLDVVYSAADQLAALNLDLDIELLRAQGKDSEALALERERRIKELMLYGDDVVAKQRKIWEEQDKRTADEARKAEEDAIAEKMRKGREDAQNKAMRNLEEATNREINSLNAQKSALNEQRTLANESLSLVTGIFDLVRQNARDLYGSVESTAVMQASQGRAFIEQALGVALKTGYLPEQDQLSQAISAARAGIDDGAFASQVDRDYDTLVLAGKLSALELLTGKQKTTAEQQLESLDRQITSIDKQSKFLQDQLAQIKDLISIAKGEYDATMSVEQAVRDVYRLFDLKTSKPTTPTPGEKDPAGDVVGGGGSPGAAPKHGDRTADGGYFREVVGPTGSFLSPTTGADTEYLKGVDKWLDKYRETGNVEGMLLDAKASGYRMNDLAAIMGWKYMDLVDAGKRLGIPQFAVGTNYVPEDMTARIHKGERIIPAADNKALFAALNSGGKGGSNAELVAEVRALRAELAAVRDNTANIADSNRKLHDNISQVTEGGNAMRTLSMA